MKASHLTLRLPTPLARALARWAKGHGLPRSHVVREALAQYIATATERPPPTANVTGRDLARRWAALPRLTPDDAASYAVDIAKARAALPPLRRPWG